MKKGLLLFIVIILVGCETPTEFSKKALADTLVSLDGSSFTFKEVLEKYKGKKIMIDVWASWCADCIKGLPKVKKIQEEYLDVVFLFLSVDEKDVAWKNGIKRFNIKGVHYNLPKGMKNGDLVHFLGLSWIPRYIVIDTQGKIALFKATNATDQRIIEVLEAI